MPSQGKPKYLQVHIQFIHIFNPLVFFVSTLLDPPSIVPHTFSFQAHVALPMLPFCTGSVWSPFGFPFISLGCFLKGFSLCKPVSPIMNFKYET